jgi:hypothetical protein
MELNCTVLMKELEKIALSKEISRNFLVATKEGKLLYESLGLELSCLYTSVVISGYFVFTITPFFINRILTRF